MQCAPTFVHIDCMGSIELDSAETNVAHCCHVLCLLLAPENKVLLTGTVLVVVAAGGECVTVFLYSRMWMAELCRDWVW